MQSLSEMKKPIPEEKEKCKQDIQVLSGLIKKNSEYFQEEFAPSSPLIESAKNVVQTLKKIKQKHDKKQNPKKEKSDPSISKKKSPPETAESLKQKIIETIQFITRFSEEHGYSFNDEDAEKFIREVKKLLNLHNQYRRKEKKEKERKERENIAPSMFL